MAKEGSVAPKERINVTFKPDTGGASEEVELPLKLMVLGDFTHRDDERKIEERKPIAIDNNNFDDVLAKHDLSLQFTVENRLQDDASVEDLNVQLNFNSLQDFNPANVVDQVPELRKLMELRDALVALKGPLGNVPAFRKAIESVLSDDDSRDRMLAELGLNSTDQPDN
ncbi:MAG: type VI secretion system contractile sheath small subunit [Pseudomonadaceae bacterium]|nr:MAG: type VI secretion system contractile sheath small subunit [Pseudomonadaceae bacterium]